MATANMPLARMRDIETIVSEALGPWRLGGRFLLTARSRHVTAYLIRRLIGHSYTVIARFMGLHHTTVLYADRKVEQDRQIDPTFHQTLSEIETAVQERRAAKLLPGQKQAKPPRGRLHPDDIKAIAQEVATLLKSEIPRG